MNVSKELALEIFDLKDDFSNEELLEAYRKLAMLVHPDNIDNYTFLKLINECRSVLSNKLALTVANQKGAKQKENITKQENSLNQVDFDLYEECKNIVKGISCDSQDHIISTLSPDYSKLNGIINLADLPSSFYSDYNDYKVKTYIVAYPEIILYPIFKKSLKINYTPALIFPASELYKRGFIHFEDTFYLPRELSKYKLFNCKILLSNFNIDCYVFKDSSKLLNFTTMRFNTYFTFYIKEKKVIF